MNRWEQVRELFEAALNLAPAERNDWLLEQTRHDKQLAHEVAELLAADARPPTALEHSAAELLQDLADEPSAEELCGVTVGEFHIEEHLASGGSAHVYRATRNVAGAQRRVALKVLRPELDTACILKRFERERQTLAALEHEHVVAFLDAGSLADGRPFLVMEYVEGVPLSQWAREVSPRTRVELIVHVAAAVQYAHQQLVVHRDLKPSNVLVTQQGTPKLLDFGVAELLSPASECADTHSPLTPSYASPEQLRGESVGTASDVFSLGVLLHEVLTDRLPEPAGNQRHAALTGDLGAVVARATAAEPAQRYASAEALSTDLKRWLQREPIAARNATWAYRSALFARRNRWPLALGVALAGLLTLGWISASLDRRLAEDEASRGWQAHSAARSLAHVFESWIEVVSASDSQLASEAAEFLEAALRDDLAEYPEAETLVRLTLAELYFDRKELEQARVHAERAWELAQITRGVGRRSRERSEELRSKVLSAAHH